MMKRGARATLQQPEEGKPRVYATNADTIVEPREAAAALANRVATDRDDRSTAADLHRSSFIQL